MGDGSNTSFIRDMFGFGGGVCCCYFLGGEVLFMITLKSKVSFKNIYQIR